MTISVIYQVSNAFTFYQRNSESPGFLKMFQLRVMSGLPWIKELDDYQIDYCQVF